MAVALQSHGYYRNNTGGGATTTGNFDTTVGSPNLLIVFQVLQGGSGAAPNFSDNQSNSYTQIFDSPQSGSADHTAGGGSIVIMYYVKNPTTSATHTFTEAQTAHYSTFMWMTFSGIDVSADPLDNHTVGSTCFVSASTLSVGPITNSSGELIVTAIGSFLQSAAHSIDSGFTIVDDATGFVPGNSYPGASAYKIGTGSSETPTWTLDASQPWFNTELATFKAAAGGGGSSIKTKKGLAVASVKTFKGLAIASTKTDKGLA